ncbi:hypothetical protein SAY86_012133 [Trapa natans]|uniref:PCI domain-containing protein n=1 Tax=Trapa natans TaxID=22666 RepID=A0AAN7LXI5_TRANT|nr:hypothetical protein SAY86_012133 [Trapa natans]
MEKETTIFPFKNDPDLDPVYQSLNRITVILIAGCEKDDDSQISLALRLTAKLRRRLIESIVHDFSNYVLGSFPDPDSPELNVGIFSIEGRHDAIKYLLEVKVFCQLLMVMALLNEGKGKYEYALKVAFASVVLLQYQERRTLDLMSTRLFFYFSYSAELVGKHGDARILLMDMYDIAIGRGVVVWQEVILHLLVRSYLLDNQFCQAEILLSQISKFQSSSNRQICCYHFYLGKIQTVQLKYPAARAALQTALLRAPDVAHGFRIQCTKWFTLACLLLGEIPKRRIFYQKGMVNALRPYLQLANSVRISDLELLKTTTERFKDRFKADQTSNVIVRLQHSAIRAGLRSINLSYSRISLAEIAIKLKIKSPDPVVDMENILAKAIRNGVVHAKLDHSRGLIVSKESEDIYSSNDPQIAFSSRIAFCFGIHSKAVRAIVPVNRGEKDCITLSKVTEEELEDLIADYEFDNLL